MGKAVSDEWDPWKRYIKHQERLQWDDWYRHQYEQERMQWDPFFRYEKEQERMLWDPYFRHLKELERRSWDPGYQRNGDSWSNEQYYARRSWWDEYMEKKQREMLEHGFMRSSAGPSLSQSIGEVNTEQVVSAASSVGGGEGEAELGCYCEEAHYSDRNKRLGQHRGERGELIIA